MPVQLPLEQGTAFYRTASTINGVQYFFIIRWNEREAAWYMDVLQDDETPIRHGLKLVLGAVLGDTDASGLMPGPMVVVDSANQGEDAAFGDLGDRVTVIAFDSTEV